MAILSAAGVYYIPFEKSSLCELCHHIKERMGRRCLNSCAKTTKRQCRVNNHIFNFTNILNHRPIGIKIIKPLTSVRIINMDMYNRALAQSHSIPCVTGALIVTGINGVSFAIREHSEQLQEKQDELNHKRQFVSIYTLYNTTGLLLN